MIKRKSFGIKRKPGTKIPKEGKSPVSKVKKDIQAALRQAVIVRDKECVVGQHRDDLPENWKLCGKYRKDGQLIVQAEHLAGRAKSVSYADLDNIVLLCSRHHLYFKKQQGMLYWALIRKHIGELRWSKVLAWTKDASVNRYSADQWREKLALIKLTTQTPIE